jgi:hypothetical protein
MCEGAVRGALDERMGVQPDTTLRCPWLVGSSSLKDCQLQQAVKSVD